MREAILSLMSEAKYKALVPRDIMKAINSENLTSVIKCLNELEDECLIIHDCGGHYALLAYFDVYLGVIDMKEAGFGFVKVDTRPKDIYVPYNDILNALDGDTVLVQVLRDTPRGPEGTIIEVVERKTRALIGVMQKRGSHYYVHPSGKYASLTLEVLPKNINQAKNDDVVKVIITDFGDGHYLKGKVDKILGSFDDVGMDIKLLVEEAMISHTFNDAVLQELQALPVPDRTLYRDLTDELIVTIDGCDAKDFDDAVMVAKLSDNTYKLGVYIADVSSYVKENSALDIEARARGFSCYLPNGVIPMLPFALSDDLCSLVPGEERYTLACEMIVENGEVIDSDLFLALIKSKARLTYEGVNKWFEDGNVPKELSMLSDAKELCEILSRKRHQKGSLDFETKEAKIILDNNEVAVDVVPIKRGISEQMIEEMMILCNETIAERMMYLDLPFLYRVHDEPEKNKIKDIISLARQFGVMVPKQQNKIHSLFVQHLLEAIDETDTKALFNHLMLRAMAKAKYSEHNIGHFGLALDSYTHFTSPIRRYADLTVHRLIKQAILGLGEITTSEAELADIALTISTKEKQIETLERNVEDMKKAEFMQKQIGKCYNGIISGVQKWGVYVELANTVEGLVSGSLLNRYGYTYSEDYNLWRRGDSVLSIGKHVNVTVLAASKVHRTVDFALGGEDDEK